MTGLTSTIPSPLAAAPRPADQVGFSEVLSALSHALDLTEGQPPGHTIRSCIIGMRIGETIGLSSDEKSALYYALLLKDAGCSSNAARMAQMFGAGTRLDADAIEALTKRNSGDFTPPDANGPLAGGGRPGSQPFDTLHQTR